MNHLCKAKRIDNGEEVKGYPFERDGHFYIIINITLHKFDERIYPILIFREVDPSTVRRSTGKLENEK